MMNNIRRAAPRLISRRQCLYRASEVIFEDRFRHRDHTNPYQQQPQFQPPNPKRFFSATGGSDEAKPKSESKDETRNVEDGEEEVKKKLEDLGLNLDEEELKKFNALDDEELNKKFEELDGRRLEDLNEEEMAEKLDDLESIVKEAVKDVEPDKKVWEDRDGVELLGNDEEHKDSDGNRTENHNDKVTLDLSKYTTEVKIRMPDLEAGDGKIVQWYKKEGDVVLYDDVLCDVETDHLCVGVTTEDEHPAIMGKILVPASDEPVPDETVICILLHESKSKEKEEGAKEEAKQAESR